MNPSIYIERCPCIVNTRPKKPIVPKEEAIQQCVFKNIIYSYRTVNNNSHLGVCDGQRVHPHPPPAPFIFNSVVEQDPKDVVDHLGYFLLLRVLGVDVSEGEHPVLPHRALQQAAGTQHKKRALHVSRAAVANNRMRRGRNNSEYMWALTAGFRGCCWKVWSCRRGRVFWLPLARHWEWSSSAVWPLPSVSLGGRWELEN